MNDRTVGGIAPQLTLAAIVIAFGVVLAAIGQSVTSFALDETLYHASAVHYAEGFPSALFNDLTARATSRLWSLLISPLFAAFDADTAIRLSRVLNAAIWVSVAVPLWLIVRRFLSPWRAVAAVALSVVAPWAVIGTTLFTEPLALVSMVWFTWAAMNAVRAPAWWRDLAVLALLGFAVVARTQMGGIFAGYLVMVAVYCWQRSGARGTPLKDRLRSIAGALLSGFPLTTLIVVAGVPAALLFMTGHTPWSPDHLFGTYLQSQHGQFWFRDLGPLYFVEITALAFGLGLIAPVAAAAWYGSAFGKPGPERDYAIATLAIGLALVVFTTFAQRGFWGTASEERYFMYVFVFIWPAALAATRGQHLTARSIVPAAIVVVLCAATIGSPRLMDGESVFLAPVLASLGTLTEGGLSSLTDSSRDAIGLAALVFTVGLWCVLRFAPKVRQDLLLIPGIALQLAFTVYPLLASVGEAAAGAGKRTGGDFERLSWIDNTGTTRASWLASEPRGDNASLRAWQLVTPFWNDAIRERIAVEGAQPVGDANPLDALPLRVVRADPRTGAVAGLRPHERVVQYAASPYVQLVGTAAAGRDHEYPELTLLELPARPRVTVMTSGLGAGDEIPAEGSALLRLWPGVGSRTAKLTVVVPQGSAKVSVDGDTTTVTGTRQISVPVEGRTTLRLRAPSGTARLTAVEVQ